MVRVSTTELLRVDPVRWSVHTLQHIQMSIRVGASMWILQGWNTEYFPILIPITAQRWISDLPRQKRVDLVVNTFGYGRPPNPCVLCTTVAWCDG